MNSSKPFGWIAVILVSVCVATNVTAEYFTDGGAGSDWGTDANWYSGAEPVSGTEVRAGHTSVFSPASVVVTQTGEKSGRIMLGYDAGSFGTVTITSGDLVSSENLYCGFNGTGSLNVNGGSFSVGNIYLPNNANAFGSIVQKAGSTVNISGRIFFGGAASGGGSVGTYTMDGGTLNVLGIRAYYGTSVFTQNSGSYATTEFWWPNYSGADATYTLNGGELTINGLMDVARASGSEGSFIQNGGTNTVSSNVSVGSPVTSVGCYLLNDGLLNITGTGKLQVGYSGNGTLHVGGSVNAPNGFTVGYNNGAIGTVTQADSGVMNLTGSYLGLGISPGAVGTYTMTGGVVNIPELQVPRSGQGTFIQNGGTNTVANRIYVSFAATGQGSYVLNGGQLTVGAEIFCPLNGSGSMTINGGKLSGSQLRLSESADDVGAVTQAVDTTVSLTGDLWFGGGASAGGAVSTYTMNGGSLDVDDERAYYGDTTFIQNGGTHTVRSTMLWPNYTVGTATYYLNDGTLSVGGAMTIGQTGALVGRGTPSIGGVFTMSGRVVADGDGSDQTLAITNYSGTYPAVVANPTTGTNGWYATNQGRLLLKPVPASGWRIYWGDVAATPTLVNSMKVISTGYGGTLDVALYAPDHTDVPVGVVTALDIWKMTGMTFTSADITFRYDHALAAARGIAEGDLKMFRHEGGVADTWEEVTDITIDQATKTITANNVTSLSWFAVVDKLTPPAAKGTTIIIK